MKPKSLFPISVIVAMRNSRTTVTQTLQSILAQKYPVKEITVIDNFSIDDSVSLVQKLQRRMKNKAIKLIRQKTNKGVGVSYNLGVSLSRSKYIVFMHSDSVLPSRNEFQRLTEPFRQNIGVIATCALISLPEKIWLAYPFWEKCLLVQAAGKRIAGLNGKCDCIDKEVFQEIGGFDEAKYSNGGDIGGEDADLALRLRKVGKVVASSAEVIHLHSLNKDYSLSDLVRNRKLLARSYGRFLRFHPNDFRIGALMLLVKPFIVVSTVVLSWPWGIVLAVILSNMFYVKIFLTPSALKEKEIFMLPFVSVFLTFYETIWMIDGFLFIKTKTVEDFLNIKRETI